MSGKQVFSVFIAGLFLLTLFVGQVFAAGIGTEAGVDVMPSETAIRAARSSQLDPLHAQFIGTEGGLDVWRAGGTCPAVQTLQC